MAATLPTATLPTASLPSAGSTSAGAAAKARAATAARRLRLVLLANATTSAAAGLIGVVAGAGVAELLGADVAAVRLIGAGLVVFAVVVAALAWRLPDDRLPLGAYAVTVADVSWVVATGLVLAVVDLTTAGRWIAVVMAVGVADFALLQVGLGRRVAPA